MSDIPMGDSHEASPAPSARSIGTAPAKLILCGEHAVVYRRPAIALPLDDIRARAMVAPGRPHQGVVVAARSLHRRWRVADEPAHPISELIANVLDYIGVRPGAGWPDLRITITSDIPIASGMGSGAAVATAVVRGLAAQLGHHLAPAAVSALVYASEQRFHGTPSGIDNTVIAYEQPIWFKRTGEVHRELEGAAPAPLIEPVQIAAPCTILIGDSGVRSATRLPVGEVRRRWQAEPQRYEALFDQIGAIVLRARAALAAGDPNTLGAMLSQNHALLKQVGVSSRELDALVEAAQAAGALGAKLSGAGWGGVMLALVTAATRERVGAALLAAGATRVIATNVLQSCPESSDIARADRV